MATKPKPRGRPRSGRAVPPAERMRAYRARKAALGLKRVSQWVADAPADALAFSSHRLLDARSLALHCVIARRIAVNPALLRIARDNLRRWRQRQSGPAPRYLDEWDEILAAPVPEIVAFITSFSDRAVRLRQSSPFAGVLTGEERNRIYDAFRT